MYLFSWYAYDSVRVVRGLCSHTRELWLNNKEIIANMLQKQTIILDSKRITKRVIRDFLRGDKYMLFQFKFIVYEEEIKKAKIVWMMLEEMKTIEISEIFYRGNKSEIIKLFTDWSIFKTRQDFHKVLTFNLRSVPQDNSVHEYVSYL